MLDDQSFIQAIAANPDDDAPRMMYADWLEERGDNSSITRAEFIRVQCALESMEEDDPAIEMLHHRETTLLEVNWRLWLRSACQALNEPLPVAPVRSESSVQSFARSDQRYRLEWYERGSRRMNVIKQSFPGKPNELPFFHSGQFRRGFLNHITLAYKTYRGEQHVTRLFERVPLQGLTFYQFPDREFLKLWANADASRLRALEFFFYYPDCIAFISADPRFSNLRELILRVPQVNTDITGILAKASHFKQLKTLIIRQSIIFDDGLRDLCRSPLMKTIERLTFNDCRLGDAAFDQLVRNLDAPNLVELDLTENSINPKQWNALRQRFGSAVTRRAPERPFPEVYYL